MLSGVIQGLLFLRHAQMSDSESDREADVNRLNLPLSIRQAQLRDVGHQVRMQNWHLNFFTKGVWETSL